MRSRNLPVYTVWLSRPVLQHRCRALSSLKLFGPPEIWRHEGPSLLPAMGHVMLMTELISMNSDTANWRKSHTSKSVRIVKRRHPLGGEKAFLQNYSTECWSQGRAKLRAFPRHLALIYLMGDPAPCGQYIWSHNRLLTFLAVSILNAETSCFS